METRKKAAAKRTTRVISRKRKLESVRGEAAENIDSGLSLKVTEVVTAGEREEWSGLTSSAVNVW